MAITPIFATYGFQDVTAHYSGPGGSFTMCGPETAAAEEGITVTWGEEMNTQTIGADGSVMNSMHSARAGTATFRLMKTSPINAVVQRTINFEHQSTQFWGRGVIRIEDHARGDVYSLLGCAWVRTPTNTYAKVGNVLEYEVHVALIDPFLGRGVSFTGVQTGPGLEAPIGFTG